MAEAAIQDDPVIRAAVEAVRAHYGDRVEAIVLFGSRARGDHGPESDYDVAVFLKDLSDYWGEMRALALISHDLLVARGAEVVLLPFAAALHTLPDSPLMHEIEADGVAL